MIVQWQAQLMFGVAAALEGLVGADLIAQIVQFAIGRGQLIAEFAVEPLALEVALLAGDPFMQPHMRCDDKLRHTVLRSPVATIIRPGWTAEAHSLGHHSGAIVTSPFIFG